MIRIYWAPDCKYCDIIKDYLESKDIQYDSINLAQKENRDARTFYRGLGINVIPVVVGHLDGDEIILSGDCIDELEDLDELSGRE